MRPPPTNPQSAASLSQKLVFWSFAIGFLVMAVNYWLLNQAYGNLQANYEAVLSNRHFQYQTINE